MSIFTFQYFSDYEDGKMARVETKGEYEIPINIFIDNADDFDNLQELQEVSCSIAVCGIGSNIEIYSSEEAYRASDSQMAVISLIPIGTFSANPDDKKFVESPHILFTGKVLDVEWNPNADVDEPNCCIQIETLEIILNLYIRREAPVEKGNVVHGVAWLFGDLDFDVPT